MELEDMKHAWQTLEQRLDQQAAQTGQLLGVLHQETMRSSLRPLWAAQTAQLLCALALAIVSARSWIPHADQPVAVIGGVLLQAWCMALAISAMVQLQLLTQLNVAGPLLRTQHALARLRRWRTRVAPWLGVAFWVLWVAVADALWRALTGQTLPADWLMLNLLVGVAGGIGTWLGFRRLQRAQHPWLERIDRAHAGTGVIRAERMLDEIARFQRD
ncbi:hypothetical protein NY751_03315 [Xanthomonas campestris]|uniref:hypothetical protein n=1 Tax=Xanthomonas campestris TaxID=339 RepID=UPI002358BE78|nr:hypothetical protein [Xanthomonas campestris]MDC8745136.1 hypothetical protein [Xanthomonas campestris]